MVACTTYGFDYRILELQTAAFRLGKPFLKDLSMGCLILKAVCRICTRVNQFYLLREYPSENLAAVRQQSSGSEYELVSCTSCPLFFATYSQTLLFYLIFVAFEY
eukprot:NODE_6_length_48303_cov_0.387022.p23 type:complete len:105 gc:universal NODE_6_length_48303_cov_0.387022:46797-47111(+)